MKLTRDFWSGALLCAVGLVIAVYSQHNYSIGTLQRMGPGYMPFALAILLSALGAGTMLVAQWTAAIEEDRHINWRKAIPVLLAVVVFSIGITRIGLVLSTIALVFISSYADTRFSVRLSLALSAAFGMIAWVVFVYFFEMNMPLFWW